MENHKLFGALLVVVGVLGFFALPPGNQLTSSVAQYTYNLNLSSSELALIQPKPTVKISPLPTITPITPTPTIKISPPPPSIMPVPPGLKISIAADSPLTGPMYWGQKGGNFAIYNVYSSSDAYYLKKLTLKVNDPKSGAYNLDNIYVTYITKSGAKLVQAKTLSSGTVTFSWATDANAPYVPKNSFAKLFLSADINGDNTKGHLSYTPASIFFNVQVDQGSNSAKNETTGKTSDFVYTQTIGGTTGYPISSYPQNIYQAYPKFTLINSSSSNLNQDAEILRFNVEVMGPSNSSVLFDGLTNPVGGAIGLMLQEKVSNQNNYTVLKLIRASVGQIISHTQVDMPSSGGIDAVLQIPSVSAESSLIIRQGTTETLTLSVPSFSNVSAIQASIQGGNMIRWQSSASGSKLIINRSSALELKTYVYGPTIIAQAQESNAPVLAQTSGGFKLILDALLAPLGLIPGWK